MRHSRVFTAAIFSGLILLAAGFHDARAQFPEPPATPPITDDHAAGNTETDPPPNRSTLDPCATADVSGKTWLDQTHDFVAENLCEPAVWFDGFFGKDRVLEDVRPGTFVKLRNAARWTEGDHVDLVGDFSIWWRLPKLEKMLNKARIFFVSGSDADKFTVQPGQPFHPGFDPATGTSEPTVGVRIDFLSRLRSLVSIDTGLKIAIPLDPFMRARYQVATPLGEVYLIRFTETALWRYTDRFTEISQLDLERKITPFTVLRWSNYAAHTDGEAGITWNSGISLLRELTSNSAVSYDASLWGMNHPEWTVQNYRVGFQYRRNFYRPWLFLDVEPEVTWPNEAGLPMDPVYAVLATLEIQFGR